MNISIYAKTFLLVLCTVVSVGAKAQTPAYEFAFGSAGDPVPLGSSNSKTDYSDYRSQFLYPAGKFTPATPTTGTITAIYFKIASKSVATTYTNFKVSIGNTSLLTLTNYVTGLTQAVNDPTRAFPALNAGDWLKIELTTPVTVDFSQPIIVDISQDKMTSPPAGYDIMTDAPLMKGNTQLYSTPASSTKVSARGILYRFGFDLMTCSTSVTKQPVDAVVCENMATSIIMEGDDVGTYQWQVDAGNGFVDIKDDGIYSGTKTNELTTKSTPGNFNNNKYRCIVSKMKCEDTTDEVKMQVDPLVALQPLKPLDTACLNSVKDLSINAKGAVNSYKWQVYTTSGGFVDVDNHPLYTNMGNVLRINGVHDTLNGGRFRCIVNGVCNTETSTELKLNVTPVPVVAASPRDTFVSPGKTIKFEVGATSAGASYQWQAAAPGGNFVNLNNGGIYSGVKTNTLYVTGVSTVQNNYRFRCVVMSSAMCNMPGDTSDVAVLSVNKTSVDNIDGVFDMVLYPNPANASDLYISNITIEGRDLKYRIVDKTGRVVITGALPDNNTRIDISQLVADIYMVQITEQERIVAQEKFTRL